MDDIVKAALAKWPNVQHCHGWLALDARGDWYMRDERVQHAGPFPRVKGSRIDHAKLKAFIERNYDADEHGAWFFQNGPQRVYLQLEAAPWVWRLQWQGNALRIRSHTGRDAVLNPGGCLLDEHGRLFLATDIGLGLVHTQDMDDAARAVEQGRWVPRDVAFEALPRRFGYQLDPRP